MDYKGIQLNLILDILYYYKQGKYDSFFHELGYAIVNNELTVQECFNFINIISSHNNIDELYENTVKVYELIKPIKNHE